MATLKEIAKRAGVSVGTVSNVMSGIAAVSEEKQRRVLRAAEELGYVPNFAASRLRRGETGMIGVLLFRSGPQADSIIETLVGSGRYPMLRLSLGDSALEKQALTMFEGLGIRGLIIEPCGTGSVPGLKRLSERGVSVITLGSALEGFASVTADDGALAEAARRAFGKPEGKGLILSRAGGTRYDSCTAGYLKCGVLPVIKVDLRDHAAYLQVMEVFNDMRNLPDVIFVSDEKLASIAYEICALFNRRADIVFPYDETAGGERLHPYLRNSSYLGRMAAEAVIDAVSGRCPGRTAGQTDIARQSLVRREGERLRLKLFDGPTARTMIRMLRPFSEQTGVEVTYELLGYRELYEAVKSDKLRADLYMIDDSWINTVSGNFAHPKNIWGADSVMPHVKKAPVRPLMVNIQLLFYRKDLFESPVLKRSFSRRYGIDLTPPKTWGEFLNLAEFFSVSPDSPTKYGTTLQGNDAITIAEEFYPRQWSYGGKIISDTGAVDINSAQNLRALKNLCETYKFTPVNNITNDWETEGRRLMNGEIAMYFTFATHISPDKDIGVAPAPGRYSAAGGWYLGVDRTSGSIESAMQLLEWATGAENARINTVLGNFVPYPHILESELCMRVHPWLRLVKKEKIHEREHLITKRGMPVDSFLVDTMLYNAVTSVFRGEETAEDALNKLKLKIENL